MLIYRIASKSDPLIGVFTNGDADAAANQARREGVLNPYNHPGDQSDCRTSYARYGICGFQSLEVYRIWFVTPGVRAAIYASGRSVMRIYEVPDHLVDVGMVQVRFKLADATFIREATPDEYA